MGTATMGVMPCEAVGENDDRAIIGGFELLSDATRLRIINLLASGEMFVAEMGAELEMTQPAVSHHLALLRVAGLIESRRDGKRNYYRLRPERLRALADLLNGWVRSCRDN